MRDIGRRHATQFPEALANELAKLNVGGITKPRVVEGGVSMLAVCAKESSQDTTYLANDIRQETVINLDIPQLQQLQQDYAGQKFQMNLQDSVSRALERISR